MEGWEREREAMLRVLRRYGLRDPELLAAMGRVPRHRFVPERLRARAYEDGPLPIGHGQTVSQPYVVGWMISLCAPPPGGRVLDVGLGSGYQAAVLAELGLEVYALERIPELLERARALLAELGLELRSRLGDGWGGWPEHAPYDGILVGAAAERVPPALLEQLAPGARLVLPVGPPYGHQELQVWERLPGGGFRHRSEGGVAFVPLVRGGSDPEF